MKELSIKVSSTHRFGAPLLGHLFKEKSGFIFRAEQNGIYGIPIHDGDTLCLYTKGRKK